MARPVRTPVGVVVAGAAKAINRAFDDALVAAGGSRPRWLILMSLKDDPHANQRQLAESIGIQGATLTHHLDAMERDRLLTRRRDPANRRVHQVELTDLGEAAFHDLLGTVVAFDRRLRRGIDEAELGRLEDVLTRLRTNVAPPR